MNKNFPHPYDYYSVIKEIDPKSVVQIDMAKDDLSTLVWLDGNPNNITNEQIEQKRQELIDDWNTNIYRMERRTIFAEYWTDSQYRGFWLNRQP